MRMGGWFWIPIPGMSQPEPGRVCGHEGDRSINLESTTHELAILDDTLTESWVLRTSILGNRRHSRPGSHRDGRAMGKLGPNLERGAEISAWGTTLVGVDSVLSPKSSLFLVNRTALWAAAQ